MSKVVNVNFRMDAELKKSMEKVCSDMGLSLTTAFTVFAKKVSREKRIPFELSADPFYSESNIQHLEKVVAGINDGTAKLIEHDIIEVD
ncbi:MAG: type II toxin-antitoxin system RelB/DinJ family antitoxin [Lachnospiraceae bacterium]|nr:type II toxin-antitoxin system RelB/DinJ family antitoxin [Lachnospiraceae bacterium]